ncbi:MAG: heavy-metal-associated domain-containing protein [Chloroflexi bacterium]|jgi:copper chaperone CopZ|nr:heavy-metal-associated domain-containing protein [Chloroflexota bacterium]
METKIYSIPNISCLHCVNKIEQAISAIEGVDFVDADLASLSVTVEYESPADDMTIRRTLETIGYPASS